MRWFIKNTPSALPTPGLQWPLEVKLFNATVTILRYVYQWYIIKTTFVYSCTAHNCIFTVCGLLNTTPQSSYSSMSCSLTTASSVFSAGQAGGQGSARFLTWPENEQTLTVDYTGAELWRPVNSSQQMVSKACGNSTSVSGNTLCWKDDQQILQADAVEVFYSKMLLTCREKTLRHADFNGSEI